MTTTHRTGWTNLYRDGITGAPHASAVWPTKAAALKSAYGETYMATVRVTWREAGEPNRT